MKALGFAVLIAVLGGSIGVAQDEKPAPSPAPLDQDGKPYKNTLRWSTASEVDNFGFDIYRSNEEEGPFKRINETPILGAGTSDLPSKYSYEDKTIDPRRGYYYYVESISMSGDREPFTPVIRAKPKLPAEGESDETEPSPDE
jgi:hypothetical protein